MPTKVLTFFNSKSGSGKTALTYTMAKAFVSVGYRVLMVDFDPKAALTALCIKEEPLMQLWCDNLGNTMYKCVSPKVRKPFITQVDEGLGLLPGDPRLCRFEESLSDSWYQAFDRGSEEHLLVVSAFHRIIQSAARNFNADWVFLDLGPYLSNINRAALLAADYTVTPVGSDMRSMVGLRDTGDALYDWRLALWEGTELSEDLEFDMPKGRIETLGYISLQTSPKKIAKPISYESTVRYYNTMLGIRKFTPDAGDWFGYNPTIPSSTESDPYFLGDASIDLTIRYRGQFDSENVGFLPYHIRYATCDKYQARLYAIARKIIERADRPSEEYDKELDRMYRSYYEWVR